MLEQNDEWAVTRHYMTLETMEEVCNDQTVDVAQLATVEGLLLATSRSAIDSSVIPALPPIADSADARVRFLGLRRLDPQLRAITRGVPSVRG